MIMQGKKDVDKVKIGMSFLSGTLKKIILKNLKTFYIFQSFNYKGEAERLWWKRAFMAVGLLREIF